MKYTIKDFKKQFPDDDACLAYIFNHRYGKSYVCATCNKSGWHKITNRKAWACAWCGFQIHPLAGTIFHKSDTPLTSWFFAIYKFSNSRNGVSAKELERDLGVTYKTAWRIASKIRSLMSMGDLKLSGTVEVDETFMEKIKTVSRN
jgi:DNA-directed RNA polymerase subunit RPC12/RpoP